MRRILIQPGFQSWQAAARRCLSEGMRPDTVVFDEEGQAQPGLELFGEAPSREEAPAIAASAFRVPRAFLSTARQVACHRDSRRWHVLYSVLWRLTHGEPELLEVVSDPDVRAMLSMERAVRIAGHKMRAFVRFRKIEREEGAWYAAWFEPEHHIVEANAPFFVDRFASMRWSILTPERCAHWDGRLLTFTPSVSRPVGAVDDGVESLWLTYYAHVFNPARTKTRAMQHSMPKKYWKNLPETSVIPTLLREAPKRVEEMIALSEMKRTDDSEWHPAEPPPARSLDALREAAAGCTACPLYKNATQTVFGEGPRNAGIVLLGEQPGDQEDRAGHPFIGPAGLLLNRALEDAGIARDECYVTNVVKHFKWEPRGKRRLHVTPNSRDIAACKPWMEAEIGLLKPKILICLGGTAAKAVFGPAIRVLKDRGHFLESPYSARTLITVHPSSLLRAPDEATKQANYELFVRDLRVAAEAA